MGRIVLFSIAHMHPTAGWGIDRLLSACAAEMQRRDKRTPSDRPCPQMLAATTGASPVCYAVIVAAVLGAAYHDNTAAWTLDSPKSRR